MFKGQIGELKTRIQLGISLNSKTYRRFHDVFAPSGNGTTQIDHLVVSQFGVFIVETKNLKGWIYGDAYQSTWTQTIYRSKHKFQNPLRQTHRQKKVLAELLNLDEHKIFPIISFVGNCKFKTKMPPNVLRGGAGKYIKDFQDPVINGLELTRLTSIIEELQSNSKIHLNEHIESLNARHSSTVTCPKCGSPLVERETKRGINVGSRFLGCKEYPKCRFTRDLPIPNSPKIESNKFAAFVVKTIVICSIVIALFHFSQG